ncbi:hypothetical protein DERP_002855 [Dermatophagoides pteronyssinus]|uniref:Uncharacterized protein n=1 Tax=Dermatophagoides pteronyssinus TaxID=6956 RepID=A0ABQ8JVX6_DERPT|nr:hypothetical protein DERP_002855 [Dermatophagoides pteronyssinus]
MINGLPFNNNKNRLNKRQSSTTTITGFNYAYNKIQNNNNIKLFIALF